MSQDVSNQGVDTPGSPAIEDVRFVASTETYEEAEKIKAVLDGGGRLAVIFHSLYRWSPGKRSSHETWHIDRHQKASLEIGVGDANSIGFDIFTAPKEIVERSQKHWDRAALCAHITKLLQSFAQTGDPSGGA